MSQIIAVKSGDKVVMSCDSLATYGEDSLVIKHEKRYKIKIVGKDTLIGAVGSVHQSIDLSLMEELFESLPNPLTKRSIIEKVVNPYYKHLKQKSIIKENENIYTLSMAFILVRNNQIFKINDYFAVTEIAKSTTMGIYHEGFETIQKIRPELSLVDQIKLFMTTIAESEDVVSSPFLIIDTRDLTYQKFNEVSL